MNDVLVLCYHGVSEDWESPLSVTPEAFERQLESLVRRGYRGATFEAALTAPPHPRTLAVTFDDAYRSSIELADAILGRLGLTGSVYIPTDFAGSETPMRWPGIDQWADGPHAGELVPLSWDELRTLADAGWEVGSHSCSHPKLTELDDDRLAAELADSRQTVEAQLGRPCTTLAYPYGHLDERVAAAARRAGYRVAGAISSTRRAAPLDWPRVGVWHHDHGWRFRLKVSPAVRRLRERDAPYDRR